MDFDLSDVRDLVAAFDPEAPTGDPFLDARHEAHRARFGHGVPYWRLFYRLCGTLRPGLCVELGAWQATCAAHMAAGNPDGQVVTIDHFSDPGDEDNFVLAYEAQMNCANLRVWKSWTWDCAHLVGDGTVDLLFVDSWHMYDKAMRDWDAYRPKLASPALVVCDDLLAGDSATIAGMRRFWDEVSAPFESFLDERAHPGFPMGFMRWTA